VQVAENELIASVEGYLAAVALAPAPASLGVAEPADAAALPAIVISLEETQPVHPGIGARAEIVIGALAWSDTIDLANPVLADDPTFRLLDATRKILILPHGGQVRQDGTAGALGSGDATITVGGTPVHVVGGVPGDGQFAIAPATGTVTFGDALPPSGLVVARYFLGQWEQRLARIAGTLRVDVCAAAAADVRTLADGVIAAFEDPGARSAIKRMNALSVSAVSSVSPPDPAFAGSRRRSVRLAYDFEIEINAPDSSGGVIQTIPVAGPDPPPGANDSQFLS
jgi:hypothetical protein